jgi:hypothetical protein
VNGSATIGVPAGSLPAGSDTLTASYSPDAISSSIYSSSSGTNSVTVTMAPSAATPAFSVAAGTYTSAQTVVLSDSTPGAIIYYTANGTAPSTSSTIYTGPITVSSTETIEAIATAGGFSQSAPAKIAYTINLPKTPSVIVSTACSSISTAQFLQVAILVSGSSGNSVPTGTVTVSSGGYTSTQTSLTNGTASIAITAGSLSVGDDTLTATYTPGAASSAIYTAAVGTASVAVTNPAYSMAATSVNIVRGASATATVVISSINGYAGTISLACGITSSPTGATDLPTCTATQTATLSSVITSASPTVTVNSTAASAALTWPDVRNGRGVAATGSAAFALLLLPWIPRRRRNWLSLIVVLVAAMLLGGVVACGGGAAGSTTPPPLHPGTAAGNYIITVTGTGNDSAKSTISTAFTLTVN